MKKTSLILTTFVAVFGLGTLGVARPLDDQVTKTAKKTGEAVEDTSKDAGKTAEKGAKTTTKKAKKTGEAVGDAGKATGKEERS
jgi:hypothetical protein